MKIFITLSTLLTFLVGYLIGFIDHIRLDSPFVWLFFLGLLLLWVLPIKKRKRAAQGLLVLCAITWAYVLVDIPLRLFFIHRVYQRLDDYLIQPWPEIPKLIRMKTNGTYNLDIIGDLSVMSGLERYQERRHIRFETDHRGFRNDPSNNNDPYDIILLGDSLGVGPGTDQDKIASSWLRNHFGIKTYNMSVPGTGPWNQLLTLQEEFQHLPTKPGTTVIWLLFPGNDLESLDSRKDRPLTIGELKRNGFIRSCKIKLRVFRNKSPLKRILNSIGTPDAPQKMFAFKKFQGVEVSFFNKYAQAGKRSVSYVQNYPTLHFLEKIMKEMKNFTRAQNINVAILIHPTKSEVYRWLFEGAPPWTTEPKHSTFYLGLKDLAEQNKIPIFDLTPAMIRESRKVFEKKERLLWWADDTHTNGEGHYVMANQIMNILQDTGR